MIVLEARKPYDIQPFGTGDATVSGSGGVATLRRLNDAWVCDSPEWFDLPRGTYTVTCGDQTDTMELI